MSYPNNNRMQLKSNSQINAVSNQYSSYVKATKRNSHVSKCQRVHIDFFKQR